MIFLRSQYSGARLLYVVFLSFVVAPTKIRRLENLRLNFNMCRTSLPFTMIRTTMIIAITLPLLVRCNPIMNDTSFSCSSVCICQNLKEDVFANEVCEKMLSSVISPIDDLQKSITHMDHVDVDNKSSAEIEIPYETMEVLDLSYNRITHIEENAFGKLTNLKYLNLANNIISNFDDNTFNGLEELKSLNLSSNVLESLPDNIFYIFAELHELSLADNPLEHFDITHINRLESLKWLDLSNTNLHALAPNMFHTLGQLEFLDLSANEFSEVPTEALGSAKKLRHLRLNENKFKVLDKKSLMQLNTLEILELNNLAHLENVMENTFSDLTNLVILEMKYNHHLISIDVQAFDGLFNSSIPTLQELDLEGNQLQTMEENTVACSRMRKFNVQKNPWVCDGNMRWIKECQIDLIYEADLKCLYPEKLQDALIMSLTEEDFTANQNSEYQSGQVELVDGEEHQSSVNRFTYVAIGVGLVVVLALIMAFVFKYQKNKVLEAHKARDPSAIYYTRARSNSDPAINKI